MLMIRLQRHGKKHQPYYRLVVGEKRSKLLGKQLESLGWYDPQKDENGFNKERISYWLGVGAKLSPTTNNLLVNAKVIAGKKIAVHKKVSAPLSGAGSASGGKKKKEEAVAPKA